MKVSAFLEQHAPQRVNRCTTHHGCECREYIMDAAPYLLDVVDESREGFPCTKAPDHVVLPDGDWCCGLGGALSRLDAHLEATK